MVFESHCDIRLAIIVIQKNIGLYEIEQYYSTSVSKQVASISEKELPGKLGFRPISSSKENKSVRMKWETFEI